MKKTMETVETVETVSKTFSPHMFENIQAVSIEFLSMETVETVSPNSYSVSPLSPDQFSPMETDRDSQTLDLEQVLLTVSTVSTVSTLKTHLGKSIPKNSLKVGDRVKYIGGDVDFDLPDGEILSVVEDFGEWVKTRTSSKKPIYIPRSSLEIAASVTEIEHS
jgi:hypothetical protein